MDTDRQSKTEAPTQRRRERRRKKGDVALSRDLTAGLGLLAAVLILMSLGDSMAAVLVGAIRGELRHLNIADFGPAQVQRFRRDRVRDTCLPRWEDSLVYCCWYTYSPPAGRSAGRYPGNHCHRTGIALTRSKAGLDCSPWPP